ncbi:mitochondrial tRNA-specific 2-thiouridylase 1 isoform X2 [Venturia canescens]|uniref:mitochondrial tRNA-specific 2-thiouridylase 1 isoform X2 n=1 Tax=Venturia canescens TaxID=32260 RepID=UPI001C9C3A0C|nr:mitochondrial tRNA-specific 2-thiouridylase 1 isoform X2 [Venturia canescens]
MSFVGFNVTAVFIKNWDTADESGQCIAENDYKDAEWVCKKLDVPLIRVDFVKEYWNDVFSYLLGSYQNGHTPNPDIECNRKIKFDKFFHYARENLKADAIATGHYARTSFGPYLEAYKPDSKVKLLQAIDCSKDQTFFMSQVAQEPLRRCMFPLGEYHKAEVKKMAEEAELDVVAKKKESMGICFIGSRYFKEFIAEYVEDKPGNFMDYDTGSIIGKHEGIHQWTLGQRCRIGGQEKPFYVYHKDVQTNDILAVKGTDHPALFTQLIIAANPHWINEEPQQLKDSKGIFHCDFRFQHQHPLSPCSVYKSLNNRLIIRLEVPQRAVTSGQFAVLYSGAECLGSAVILHPGPSLHSLGQKAPASVERIEPRLQSIGCS